MKIKKANNKFNKIKRFKNNNYNKIKKIRLYNKIKRHINKK